MEKHRSAKRRVRLEGLLFLALLILGVLALNPRTSSQEAADRPAPEFAPATQPDAAFVTPHAPQQSRQALAASVLTQNLPLTFEPNRGQTDKRVRFLSRAPGYNVFLTSTEAVFALRGLQTTKNGRSAEGESQNKRSRSEVSVLRMALKGANPTALTTGVNQLPGVRNYLIRARPGQWQTDVPTYGKVRYEEIYPGIDLTFYGNQQQLEYDFEVAPGADPGIIKFVCHGANPVIDSRGDLVLKLERGVLRQHKPVVYQYLNGERVAIDGRFVMLGRREIGFEIGDYDRGRALVIDPTLVYSTYLGAAGIDTGSSIDVDNSGNIYVAGTTNSATFPTRNPFRPSNAGLEDVFITKLDPTGGTILYSTYVGGSSNDRADAIFVDRSSGAAYVVGRVDAASADFPTTPGALATVYRGGDFDAFVLKLNSAGNSLAYSTFLGGEENDSATGVVADLSGNAYVTGGTRSSGFPATPNAYQPFVAGGTDAYLVKVNPAGSSLPYATLLGGGGTDRGSGVRVDSSGNAYFAGFTGSTDFPTQNAFQNSLAGSFDGFVGKIDTNASGAASLVFCSYLGGVADDKAYGIAIDGFENNVFVVGQTSSNNFPVLHAAQPNSGGSFDAFIARIGSSGTKIHATYLGGSGDDHGTGIAVNFGGGIYVTGFTSSNNFPVVSPLQSSNGGGVDAFVTNLHVDGRSIIYSTYLGGSGNENTASTVTSTNPIAMDSSGDVYVTGYTASTNFPTLFPLQTAHAGGQDAFIVKITKAPPGGTMQFNAGSFTVNEGAGSAVITVTRTVITANSASVEYTTSDASATNRTDYITTSGTLYFAAGETSKTFAIPLVDDVYVESNEAISLTLKNPSSGGFLGSPTSVVLTIADNDSTPPTLNPLDEAQFFVRQHYLDFLNREPDPGGLVYWANEITKCGSNVTCINDRRISVSAAFFFSDEFQESGGFVNRVYQGTLGRQPTYAEFSADRSKVIGGPNLQANKSSFLFDFIGRPEFKNKYPDYLYQRNFIDPVLDTASSSSGVDLSSLRNSLIPEWDNCSPLISLIEFCRMRVIEQVINQPTFKQAVFNQSFVLMEYFGYLRRDIDTGGYQFWLDVLNNRQPNNYRGMVCSFITSAEYQQRFSPVITRTNQECAGVR